MKMPRTIFVIGTRAQLVKVAPVLRAAIAHGLPHAVWFTGQHRESIDDLIDDFRLESEIVLPKDHRERSSVGSLIGWMPRTLLDCRRFIERQRHTTGTAPLVVVHGDTLSTFLGAVAARHSGAEVVHLESGLGSGSVLDPFPEELLRRLTFRLARHALCPNDVAADRMRRFKGCSVVNTGENTLLDSVRYALTSSAPAFNAPGYFVVSIHRFQNVFPRARLAAIVSEIRALSRVGRIHFVMHPATERRLRDTGLLQLLEDSPYITLSPRLRYTEFLGLLSGARGVISDGGSNQEELSYLGVPTVLCRERTERPDGIGRNVVFESDVHGPIVEFVESGRLEQLRTTPILHADVQPSECCVVALGEWARTQVAGE